MQVNNEMKRDLCPVERSGIAHGMGSDFPTSEVEPRVTARVVHVNDRIEDAVYIGRANGRKRLEASPFANPFRVYGASPFTAGTDLASVIRMYRDFVTSHSDGKRILTRLPELRGKPLACWCRHDGELKTEANACHGDVLIELLDLYTDDELRQMAGGTA